MRTLNIIGAGKLGRTLGRLWHRSDHFRIRGICNQTTASAQAAREFIGAGEVYASIAEMAGADCWLIATGDRQIAAVAAQLASRLAESSGALVFHCSGALGSEILAPCRPAAIASAHPVHSFANPTESIKHFAGTTIALEGDETALSILRAAFSALGCEQIEIAAEHKTLYHAGSVFACNYFTALMDLSLQCFAAAGIDQPSALKLLQPIVLQTARNNLSQGPQAALTGPIARGDSATVAAQLRALETVNPELAHHYRQLGLACLQLAQSGGLSDTAVRELQKHLSENRE